MSYTRAFNHLHRLSYAIDLKLDIQYRRVAIYIGRIMMAEACTDERIGTPDMPIKRTMEWVERLYGHKETMLDHLVQINDYEWNLISKAMREYADRSRGSQAWIAERHAWITTLDTLRAFH